jgi:hypothetical protein
MSEWILLLVMFAVPIAFFALYPAILRAEGRRLDKWMREKSGR